MESFITRSLPIRRYLMFHEKAKFSLLLTTSAEWETIYRKHYCTKSIMRLVHVLWNVTIKSTCKIFEKIHSDLVDHIANAPYMGEYLPLTLYLLLSDSNQTDVPWQLKDSACKQSRLLRSGIFTAIWQGTVSRGKSHKRKTSWTRSFKNVCMKGLLKFEYEWFSV